MSRKLAVIWEKYSLVLIFLGVFLVYLASSAGPTPYDYFTRLAEEFLKGKYWLENPPRWLNETVPVGMRRYVVYPPGPAVLLVPFVAIIGRSFEQQLLAHLLGAGFVVGVYKMAMIYVINKHVRLWVVLLAALGNILWYMASNGSVWYLGLVSGAFFIIWGIVLILSKKCLVWVGVFFGLAFLSRLQLLLALPLFLYLITENYEANRGVVVKFLLGFLPFLLGFLVYNYLRFGSFWETGYGLIPGVLDEPWYDRGLFHFSYIPNHIKVMFGMLPKIMNGFPYVVPSLGGLAIWITTPSFVYIFIAGLKSRMTKIIWISVLAILFVDFSYGSTGFTQFGYRYAVDVYPLLFILLMQGVKKLAWHHWVVLSAGVIVNLWGVIVLNKLGVAVF